MYESDKRIVMTLDAGGTNFVFSAIQGNKHIVSPICMSSESDNLDNCLNNILEGFRLVKKQLLLQPVAISFAFPGPADYKNGVIVGNLPNFPSFRSGVALGQFLQYHFGIPVYIENDGNLFAYGEALSGVLPMVNEELSKNGNNKKYRNLLGITLGTGFGAGVVINNVLLNGDNGCGGDVWLDRNKKYPSMISEESVSVRAVKRVYQEKSGIRNLNITPKDIFDIAEGVKEGDKQAAVYSFMELGEIAGSAIASALNIVDGLVVIGGGLSGAYKYILPSLINELRSELSTFSGERFPCVQMDVYNWENEHDRYKFLSSEMQEILVYGTDIVTTYSSSKKIAVMLSRDGASTSIMRGAYAYALSQIDNH